ncbi:MAG TPA: hypothetical protein VFX15_02930 [Actinomycetes bacterium]|nr:hypothetical protein [Actinomycetes bacterium]
MAGETIDAIRVGLGIDRTALRQDIAAANREFNALPSQKTVNIHVAVHTPTRAVEQAYESIQKQFDFRQRQAGSEALRISPRMVVDPRVMRDFRRDIERNMRQSAQQGQAIRVPVRFNGDVRSFIASVQQAVRNETVTIGVKGDWRGGPGGGTGGGGVGRTGPSQRPPTGGAPAAQPEPARSRPATARARGTATEVRSGDVYEAQEQPPRTPRQQRQTQRRQRMGAGAPAGAPAPLPAAVMPADARGRVDIGNVRQSSSGVQELQGEERTAYISQQRARPTRPMGQFRQRGERVLTAADLLQISNQQEVNEYRSQDERRQAARARGMSPRDVATREHIRSGFHSLDPDLAALYDRLMDPEPNFSFDQFIQAAEAGREAYGTAFHGSPKQVRRQRAVARGTKKGDINEVDPTLLVFDAALDAAREFQRNMMDPLNAVRAGDNKRRGRGGKVGQIGGRNAGRLASTSMAPEDLEERIRKESRRAARLRQQAAPDIVAGQAYGGGAEIIAQGLAPSIAGGQGLTRGSGVKARGRAQIDIDIEKMNAGQMTREEFERRHRARIQGFAEGGRMRRNWGDNEYMRGLYGRDIGASFGAPEGHENVARANTTEWKRTRRNQLREQPFCAHCGIGRAEARSRGIPLSADKIRSQAQGGNPFDPSNLQTLCSSCNSRKSGSSAQPLMTWTHPRPNIGSHPKWSQVPEGEFLPTGKFFGVSSLSEMLSRSKGQGQVEKRAEGGQVKHGGLLQRMAQAGHQPSITLVGERGPELLVTDEKTGETEVVPTHKVPTWLQRAQGSAKGLAKDMTERGGGGRMARMWKWGGGYAEGGQLRMRDTLGRPARATEARMTGGVLAGGDITRVFVVNWPNLLASPGQFAQSMGQAQAQAARSNPQQARAASPPPGQQQNQQGPQGPGAGAPAGAPAPGATTAARLGRVDPLLRVRARRTGFQAVGALEEELQTAQAGIGEALQRTPVRALSVAFGQIAQNVIGGREQILTRAARARRIAGRAQQEVTALRELESQRSEARQVARLTRSAAPGTDEANQYAAATERIRELRPAIGEQREVAGRRVAEAQVAQGKILTTGQQVTAQAVGLGGIIAGTATFSSAIAAFQLATQAGAAALTPLVDALTGFPAAIERSTTAVRDAITQSRGQVGVGVAAAVAPTGLSAQFLDQTGGNFVQTAVNRAAQAAAQQATDIIRSQGALRGGDRGLYEGVGGLFGTNIGTELFGGQAGFLQEIQAQLEALDPRRATLGGGINQLRGPNNVGTGTDPVGDLLFGRGGGDRGVLGQFTSPPAEITNNEKERQRLVIEQNKVVDELNRSLRSAADYAGDASEAFQLTTRATKEQTDAMIASAAAISDEAKTRAQGLARAGVTVLGPGGRALQGRDFEAFARQQARGQLIQDPALLLRQTEPQRRARAEQLRRQGEFTRREDLPAAFALQQLANPPLRFGTTFNAQGQGLENSAEGRATLQNIAKYSQLAADASADNARVFDMGMSALEKIVSRLDNPTLAGGITPRTTARRPSGPGFVQATQQQAGPNLTAFRGLISDIGEIGTQIADIQSGLNLRQVNLQVKEYNNQIRITQRSLQDANDFWAAIHGNVSDTVGGLQGQNALLERQNQLLSRRAQRLAFKSEDIGFKQADLQFQAQQLQFQLSQRQINFQRAVAGFSAPGSTPEERAARINEAKVEADFAQKQLDLQIKIADMAREQLEIAKQQAGVNREIFANSVQQQDNQFAIQMIEAQRAVQDIAAQLSLLQEGRAVVIDTAAAEEAIERLRKRQARLIEAAQSYIEQGQEVRSQVLSDINDLQAATGKGFSSLVSNVQKAWSEAFRSSYTNYLLPLMNSLNQLGSAKYGNYGAPGAYRPQAEGGIHDVSTPTRFMAGEAGHEKVLVIRNPQEGMFMPSGGMGGGTVVNIGGITISVEGGGGTEEDAERLAAAVERRISTKLAMIGG